MYTYLQPEEFNVPHSSSATSQIGQLQLCNEDTPFAVMCVSWLLSMTPQAASTCFRWLTSVAATRDLSQRRYSGNSSSFVDSTSLLPVASLIAVTTRTRQRTTRPHCKVEVWNFFNFLGHVVTSLNSFGPISVSMRGRQDVVTRCPPELFLADSAR